MIRRILPFLFIAAVLSVASCKRESDDRFGSDITRGYFPLELGHYVLYDVDSTIWDDFKCTKADSHYQMRYTIADTFRDNELRLSYQVDVHIRKDDTQPWRIDDVFYITPTSSSLEWVQNNLRFTKLVFPVADGATWNGNSQIATNDQDLRYFEGWMYKYSNKNDQYNNGRVAFDNTVTVNLVDEKQNDPDTMPTAFAYRSYGREVYAHGVGLIYREMLHWDYQYNPTPGSQSCRKGYSVVMRATEHN